MAKDNSNKQSSPKGKPKEKRRNIVRIMKKDLNGDHSLERGIRGITGINFMLARAVRIKSGIDKNKKLSELKDNEIEKIEKILENIYEQKLPAWLLNRRKDFKTGVDTHNFEADLMLSKREDLERMKKIKSYKGVRHMHGLKVRGQKTKSTGRKESSVGVKRKKKVGGAGPGEGK